MGKKTLAIIGSIASLIYIINPTFGVYELIPDNLPFVGNIDEATATAILIWGVRVLFSKEETPERPDILDNTKN